MKAKIAKEILQLIYDASQAVSARYLTIDCSTGGWDVTLTDPAHVSMVHMQVLMDSFIEYDMEDCRICVPTDRMKSMLSVMEKEIDLTYDDGRLTMKSGNMRRATRTEMPDEPSKPIPEFDMPCSVTIDTADMKKVLGASGFTDHAVISMGPEGTVISSEGDTDELDVRYPEAKTEEACRSSYPLDYLTSIIKAMPSDVTLSMNTDYPLKVSATEPMFIEFMLAPRIEQ